MKNKPETKEALPVYAVLTDQRITDLFSLKQAESLAKQTNGKIWQMLREGEEIQFLFPI